MEKIENDVTRVDVEETTNEVTNLETANTENIMDQMNNSQDKSRIVGNSSDQHDIHYRQISNVYDKNEPGSSYLALLSKFDDFRAKTEAKIQKMESFHEKKLHELKEKLKEYSYRTAVLDFKITSYEKLNLLIARLNELGIYVGHKTESVMDHPQSVVVFDHVLDSNKIKVTVCLGRENITNFNEGIREINKESESGK